MAARLETFLLREWQRVSAWQVLLQPLSWIFRSLVWSRRQAFALGIFQSRRIRYSVGNPVGGQVGGPVGCPIIVVGNISVGGTGKTPLVLALVCYLQQQKKMPGILTRGYMPKSGWKLAISPTIIHVVPDASAQDNPALPDEAMLLSERSCVPVFAGANRVAAGARLLQDFPATDLLVCDDGLQHYAMQRDVEIVVVDASRGFGNGFCLPAGPLREPLSRLAQVDCIVLNCASIDGHLETKMPEESRPAVSLHGQLSSLGLPVFEMTYADARMQRLAVELREVESLSPLAFCDLHRGRRIVAVAGIGNPGRFFDHLRSLGLVLQNQVAFPDHHRFAISDLRNIEADVILMTDKDAVKCRQFAAVDQRLWSMRIDAKLPATFYEFVLKKATHVT